MSLNNMLLNNIKLNIIYMSNIHLEIRKRLLTYRIHQFMEA